MSTKPPRPPDEKEPDGRIKMPTWQFSSVFENARDLREFGEVAQKKAVADIESALREFDSSQDYRKLGEIFGKRSFEEVQLLAKGGKRMSAELSNRVADLRRRAIWPAMTKALEALDPKKQLKVGLLNSGNKKSGAQNDVDQTVFLFPKELAKELGVDEVKIIAEFNRQFEKMTGVKPEKTGISTLSGADFYPDWRQKQTVAEFSEECARVFNENRKDPNAYRSEGQLKSQVEGRGYEAIQEHHRRVRELRAARDKIEAGGGDPGSLAAMEKEVEKNSPWTEIGWDAEKKPSVSHLEDPKSRVLTSEPEKVRRFAYDGAWDNWLMFEQHPENRLKYLLRSFSEGASLLRQKVVPNRVLPFEYERFYADGRHDLCERVVNEVYAGLPPGKIARFRKALDAAARDRMCHKGETAPGKPMFTEKEILQEYRPVLSEAEARIYEGMGREAVEKMLDERARRAWEADAREMMIENLERTIQAPQDLLKCGLSYEEFARIRKEHPAADHERLAAAVRSQLYNSFREFLTIDHAKELTAPPEMKEKLGGRQKDMVDRFLAKLDGDPALKAQVLEIVRDVAAKRVASEPGLRTFRVKELYAHLNKVIRAKWGSSAAIYRQAKADYDKGVYTKEVIASKLMVSYAERWAHVRAQVADSFGFNVKNVNIYLPDKGMPRVELEYQKQKFDGRKLLANMASAGNLDSAVQVVLAYQEGGAEAAAWAASFELIMNVPGVAHVVALKDLVVNRKPQGVVMLGSAMLIPNVGGAYILVSITTNCVRILGNAVLHSLGNDVGDNLYQGFLDEKNGVPGLVPSKRAGLLYRVPVRIATVPTRTPDGKTTERAVWRAYTEDEVLKACQLPSLFPGEYEELAADGVIGGGSEWDEKVAVAADGINHPREEFEAQRAGLYYYFRGKLGDDLGLPGGLKPEDPAAFPHLVDLFLARIDDWVNARGDFEGLEENVIISRKFADKELCRKIASRAAADLVRSRAIVKSIEDNIAGRIELLRDEKERRETNAMILATDDAYRPPPEPQMALAVYNAVDERRDSGREKAPRIHVRPRVVAMEGSSLGAAKMSQQGGTNAGDDKPGEGVDFAVSVLADPEEYPPVTYDGESAVYDILVTWTLSQQSKKEKKVSATVQVFDKNKKLVGAEENIPIGIVGRAETPRADICVTLAEDRNYEDLPLFPELHPIFLEVGEPKNLKDLPPFKEDPASLGMIHGFKYYRRFDAPEPADDLRFGVEKYSDSTMPGSHEPNTLVKVTGKDRTDWIGTMILLKPYTSYEEANYRRPWDPADPLPPRWFSYSVLMLKKKPPLSGGSEVRNLQLPAGQYQEGPLAPWVRCLVEPAIELLDKGLLDPDKENVFEWKSGSLGLQVRAVVTLNGERAPQKYQPDYQEVTPGRKRKYIYKVDFGDHCRYAVCNEPPDHRKSFATVTDPRYYKPGTYTATISVVVDGQTVSAPVRLERTDSLWERNVAQSRESLQRETRGLNEKLANLDRVAKENLGEAYSSVSSSFKNISRGHMSLCEFAEAERAAKQAVEYERKAVAAGARSNTIYLEYRNLAEVYLAWGKPEQYRGAREAEFQSFPPGLKDVWTDYKDAAFDCLALTGDVEAARGYYQRAIRSFHGTGTPPSLPEEMKP